MIAIKHRQRLWFKAIAIGVVCLLTLNSISWAMPKHTLAAQSRFNLFSTNNGLGLQNNATILYAVNGLKELISSDTLSQGSIARLNKSVGTKFHDTNIAIGTDFEEGELRSKGKREYKLFTFGFQKENIEIETLFLPDHTNLTPEEKDELKERFKVKNDTDRAYLDCPGLEGVWFVNPTTKQSATVRKVKRQQDSIFREGGDELAMAGLSDVALRGRGIVTKADAEGADLELPSEPSPNLDARPGQVVGDKCRTVVTWLRDQSLGLILGLLVADVIATIFLIVKLPNPRTTESQFDRNATKVESDSDIENIGDPAVLVERLRKWDRKIQAAKKLVELAETDPAKTIPILVKNASAGYGECSASSVLVKIGKPAIPYLVEALKAGNSDYDLVKTFEEILEGMPDLKEAQLDVSSEIALLVHNNYSVQRIGKRLLERRGWAIVPQLLREITERNNDDERDGIARLISDFIEKEGAPEEIELQPVVSVRLLSDKNWLIAHVAEKLLVKAGGKDVAEMLNIAIANKNKGVVKKLLDMAKKKKGIIFTPETLEQLLAYDDWRIIESAVKIALERKLPISFKQLRMPIKSQDSLIQAGAFKLIESGNVSLTSDDYKFLSDNCNPESLKYVLRVIRKQNLPIPLILLGYKEKGDLTVDELNIADLVKISKATNANFDYIFADALISNVKVILKDSPGLTREIPQIKIPLLRLLQKCPYILTDSAQAEKRLTATIEILLRAREERMEKVVFGGQTEVILVCGDDEKSEKNVEFLEEHGVKRENIDVFQGTSDAEETKKVREVCLERIKKAAISLKPTTIWHRGHGNGNVLAFMHYGPRETDITYREYAKALVEPWSSSGKKEVELGHLIFIQYGCLQYDLTEKVLDEIRKLATENGLAVKSLPVFVTKSNKEKLSSGIGGFVGVATPEKGEPLKFKHIFESDENMRWDDPAIFIPFEFDSEIRGKLGIPESEAMDGFLEISSNVPTPPVYLLSSSGAIPKRDTPRSRKQGSDAFRVVSDKMHAKTTIAEGSLAKAIITINRKLNKAAFTKNDFQAKRIKPGTDEPFSDRTIYSELNGLIRIGILEVLNKNTRPYHYQLTANYRSVSPAVKRKITTYLKSLHARPAKHEFRKARRHIKLLLTGEEAVRHMARKEAYKIHTENLRHEYMPDIEPETILCHIVTDSILPSTKQKKMLKKLSQDMRKDKTIEKVVCLEMGDKTDSETFMRELEKVKAQEEARYQAKGYTVQFDIACPSQDLVAMVQDQMPALAFENTGNDEHAIIQLEGIMLALRVLRKGSMEDLRNVYKLLTGQEPETAKTMKELAKKLLFTLPITKLDVDEIDRINTLIKENIEQAA